MIEQLLHLFQINNTFIVHFNQMKIYFIYKKNYFQTWAFFSFIDRQRKPIHTLIAPDEHEIFCNTEAAHTTHVRLIHLLPYGFI